LYNINMNQLPIDQSPNFFFAQLPGDQLLTYFTGAYC